MDEKNILLVEQTPFFRSDVTKRSMFGGYPFNIFEEHRMDAIMSSVEENNIDMVVVNAGLLPSYPDWDIGVPVYCYALNASGIKTASGYDIPCYGLTAKAGQLLDKIMNNDFAVIERKPDKSVARGRAVEDEDDEYEEYEEDIDDNSEQDDDYPEHDDYDSDDGHDEEPNGDDEEYDDIPGYDDSGDDAEDYEDDDEDEEEPEEEIRRPVRRAQPKSAAGSARKPADTGRRNSRPAPEQPKKERTDARRQKEGRRPVQEPAKEEKKRARSGYEEDAPVTTRKKPQPQAPAKKTGRGKVRDDYDDRYLDDYDDEYTEEEYGYDGEEYPDYDSYDGEYDDDYDDDYDEEYERRVTEKRRTTSGRNTGRGGASRTGAERTREKKYARDARSEEREAKRAKREFEKEAYSGDNETKVVTVTSAKGGVGKTTISTSLATYLALTSNGRRKYKVCIVDNNIDFGDVLQTLDLDANVARERACLTIWAADIRERVRNGEAPEKITYTKKEIDRYLLFDKDSGLYALAAPISNEDSLEIDSTEVDVVLNNLINKGDFDFIICDTGNSTRNATMLSIEKADIVLMVTTQDMNSINGNDSMLRTLHKAGVDISKFRLIVNQAKPEKAVGLSLDIAKTGIDNPANNKPIECIAVINDSDSVKTANNECVPLVYNNKSAFTKSIKDVASYIIGDEHAIQEVEPERKGIFSWLFGRNRGQ